jgi:hypothetical protein
MSRVERERLREEVIRLRDEMLRVAEPFLALKPGDWVTPDKLGRALRALQKVIELLDLLVRHLVEEPEEARVVAGGLEKGGSR